MVKNRGKTAPTALVEVAECKEEPKAAASDDEHFELKVHGSKGKTKAATGFSIAPASFLLAGAVSDEASTAQDLPTSLEENVEMEERAGSVQECAASEETAGLVLEELAVNDASREWNGATTLLSTEKNVEAV